MGCLSGFTILHLNVRSLVPKVNQLRIDLPYSGIDIFSLSETWLNSQIENKLISITGYNFIGLNREITRPDGIVKQGGGVGIYYKEDIHVDANQFRGLNKSDKDIEIQWVVVKRPNTRSILLGNTYRPPDGNVNNAFKIINDALMGVKELHKFELLVLGDFNVDYKNTNSKSYKLARNFALNHSIPQIIEEPTRYSKKSNTIIDLAFTNIKYCTRSGVLDYNLSDHKAIYLVKKKIRNCHKTVTHMGRVYTNCSYEDLEETLAELNTDHIMQIADPNVCWHELFSAVTKAADKLCPIRELRIRKDSAPFINNTLIELQKDRDYFVRKADRSGEEGDRFVANCMVKKARSEVKKAKAQYHKAQVKKHLKKPRKYWIELNKINPGNKKDISNICHEHTGALIQPEELPEKVNDYFTQIGPKLASKFKDIDIEKKYLSLA